MIELIRFFAGLGAVAFGYLIRAETQLSSNPLNWEPKVILFIGGVLGALTVIACLEHRDKFNY